MDAMSAVPTPDGQVAIRLMRYLRDLARARREPILDVAVCPQVHWLNELPDEIYVETDAGPGDVLFSVPVIPLTPPAALSEFDGLLALRRWYRALRTLAAEHSGGEHELVLATGLLTGGSIHNHLLTTLVRVVIDPQTERADVVLLDRPSQLHDRTLLEGIRGFRPERIEWVHDAVHARQGYALQDSVADVLRKWCSYAFDDGIGFREDWADEPAGSTLKVRLAPALVLRPRGRGAVLDYYDAIVAELQTNPGPLPPGVADFLSGPRRGFEGPRTERLALLTDRTEHTTAELVTTLLSHGRRVLVTTPKPEELRAALPEALVPLVASPATAVECLSTLSDRFLSYDPERHEESLRNLESRLATVQSIIADLRDRAGTISAEQIYDFAPGYRGTQADITRLLTDRGALYSWMPLADRLPPHPPLNTAEASELLRLLDGQTPRRAARTAQTLPEPAALPHPDHIRQLIDTERTGAEAKDGPDLTGVLARCDPNTLGRLTGCAAAVTAALNELGLSADPARWDEEDWAVRALRDGLARRTGAWDHVAELAGRAATADRALRYVGTRQVTLPPLPENEQRGLPAARVLHERAQLVRELRDYLAGGGTMHRGLRKPPVQKAAEPALSGAAIDGFPPHTAPQLDVILAELECRATIQELISGWQAAGVVFPSMVVDGTSASAVAAFAAAYSRLSHVRTALLAVAETASLVFAAGVRVALATPAEWQEYTTALAGVRLRTAATRATAALAEAEHAIEREIRKGNEPPELRAALAALKGRDVAGYAQSIAGLSEALGERLVQARFEELNKRMKDVHPDLAALMAKAPGDAVWATRLAGWEAAWTWAYVSAELRHRPRSDMENQLRESLAQTEERQTEISGALTASRAWGWALSRMTATARPSPGAPAPGAAQPAWAIPLWQVPEIIPPRAGVVDVVVVDEGTAEDVEALFLLWPAPRVIFVGAPAAGTAVSIRPAEDERVTSALAALPPALAQAVRPAATLFEALNTRLGPIVRTGDPEAAALTQPREPEPAPEPEPAKDETEQPAKPHIPIKKGRSIAEYKRVELVRLMARLAESRPNATDDALVAHAVDLLECPPDEEMLTSARLHYALGLHREG